MMEKLKFQLTVPNILSLVRLALLPLFAWFYLDSARNPQLLYWSLFILGLSGITDLLDGWIARRFDQITELGKLLDPFADKLTQIVVLVCLTVRYHALIPLVILCGIKEILQAIGGWLLLSRNAIIRGSKWFGKVSTFTFYLAMLSVVLWKTMPRWFFVALIVLVGATMLFSFFGYLVMYIRIRKTVAAEATEAQWKG